MRELEDCVKSSKTVEQGIENRVDPSRTLHASRAPCAGKIRECGASIEERR
jgi:hypothetical protein